MLKIFKSCIETGVYPVKDSPCYKKLIEILENNTNYENKDTNQKTLKTQS